MQRNFCSNRNHSRSNAPVRYCPQCGEVVNGNVPDKKCSEEEHAKRRREINRFCMDCGTQLIK